MAKRHYYYTETGAWRERMDVTLSELLRALCCPTMFGLSGNERELDLVLIRAATARRPDPYPARPAEPGTPPMPPPLPPKLKPLPRREPTDADAAAAAAAAAAIFMLEQNEMLDLRRELCRSNVFWAENGDGRTR